MLMSSLKSLREELEELRADILSKRAKPGEPAIPEFHEAAKPLAALEHQISELNRMVKTMLDDAETTVADHPAATVAGALALGIVIGRLTAR
jgi:ElaB/YqjD/DUF883 family membrane-anchored ribosome-binding protein